MSNCKILVGVVTIILSGFSFAGEVNREGAVELLEECQRQRQINIAPLREQAIEDCVINRRRDREFCERHNRNFGERRSGGTVVGMFFDLFSLPSTAASKYRVNSAFGCLYSINRPTVGHLRVSQAQIQIVEKLRRLQAEVVEVACAIDWRDIHQTDQVATGPEMAVFGPTDEELRDLDRNLSSGMLPAGNN
jgi:hypothetical protein